MRVEVRTNIELWAREMYVEVIGRFVDPEHPYLEQEAGDAARFKMTAPESEIISFIETAKKEVLERLKERKARYERARALATKLSTVEEYLI